MNWNHITSAEILEEIKQTSHQQKVLIFKHSTRCSISSSMLNRLERAWKNEEIPNLKPYFLDLISYRALSNQIAENFLVEHESPQVIVLENGKPIYHTSHNGINYQDLKDLVLQS